MGARRRRGFVALTSVSAVAVAATLLSGMAPAFAAGGKPSSGSTGSVNVTIDAFNRAKSPGVWTKGNTSGYAETNAIPFRLGLDNSGGKSAVTVTSLESVFDFSDTASNGATVPGIADLVTTPALANKSFLPGPNPTHDFAVCGALSDTPLPPTGTGAVAGSCTTIPWVPVGGSQSCQPSLTSGQAPSTGAYIQGPYCSAGGNNGLIQGKYVWHNIPVPAGQQATLVWGALLALHSHLYNGSSLHMLIGNATLNGGTVSFGNKDVPIPVNQILATATDKKVNGSDGPVQLKLGDVATVTITASAFGPKGSSQGLTITDHLPACLAYEDTASPSPTSAPAVDSSGDVVFGPITVAGGGSTTVSFQVKAIAVNAQCDNVAVTTSSNPDVPPTSDDVQTPVSGVARLTVSKDCASGGTTATPGGTVQQTLNFANSGTADSNNVTVTDVLSAGQTIVGTPTMTLNGTTVPLGATNYSKTTDATTGVTTLTFAVGSGASLPGGGTLAKGDSGTIVYTVKFPTNSSATDRTFTDTANILSGGTVVGSSQTCSTTLHYLPDLGLNKSCPVSAPLNSTPTHTLSYSADDQGTGPATNATIVDTLPSGESYVPNSAKLNGNPITPTIGTGTGGAVTLTFALGTLQPGDSGSVTYSVTMTSSSPQTDSAVLSSDQTDRDSTDNSSQCTTGVTTIDVFVDKNNHCTTNTAVPGGTTTQTIDFGNSGNTAATGVKVTDVLEAGETFVKATLDDPNGTALTAATGLTTSSGPGTGQTTVTYDAGTLAPATSHTLYVTVRFASTATSAGVVHYQDTAGITTTSSETGGTANNTSGPCSTNVDYEPALTVTKTACPSASVVPGGEIIYTLTYRNNGTAPATPATLTDDLPNDGTGHPTVSVLDNGGGTESSDHLTVTWTIASIGIGGQGSKTLSVLVNAPSGSQIINKAELTSGSVSATPDTLLTLVSNGGANTHGLAYGLDAHLGSTQLLRLGDVGTSAPPSQVAPPQSLVTLGIPGVVTVGGLINTASHSSVDDPSVSDEPGASSLATSEVANLNLLSGALKASVVKASSESSASALSATYSAQGQPSDSSTGSHFVNLQVNGQSFCQVPVGQDCTVAPNTTVDLTLAGVTVARAVLNEQTSTGSSLTPAGGLNRSDLTVNMVHVTLLKAVGTALPGTEIIVASAHTDAAYGSGYACGAHIPSVSGNAFAALAQGTVSGTPVLTGQVGDANLPVTGGAASDSTFLNVPGVVVATAATDTTNGSLLPNPHATAHSVITNANVLGGLITADTLDVRSSSTVGGPGTAQTCAANLTYGTCFDTTFLNLNINVNGQTINVCPPGVPCTPAPNTEYLEIPSSGPFKDALVEIVFNEQRPQDDNNTDASGFANAIHVWVFKGNALQLEVTVAHAHSDAHLSNAQL